MLAHAQTDLPSGAPAIERHATRKSLIAGVTFGVRRDDGSCVNIGICRVVSDFALQPSLPQASNTCAFAYGCLGVGEHGNVFLFFPRTNLKPCTEQKIFRHGSFPVPLDFALPDEICAALEGLQQPVIKAGHYPIRYSSKGYLIDFLPTFAG